MENRLKKYRMYVDEVGNSDMNSSDNPNHRFLSLTGVILDLEYVKTTIHNQMENLKKEFFDSHPDEPVIFHRKEMLNAKHPFTKLKDPLCRELFDEKLLNYLNEWTYRVITVCVDKFKHRETYTTWRYDPYHYCLSVLLERFVLYLSRQNACGDVMAESRGGKEDRRLKDSFHKLWGNGTDYIETSIFQKVLTSKQLKIKPKTANITGLQLADLIAHPSRFEILKENGMIEKALPVFGEKIIRILRNKYDCNGEKIYGKKLL
jgi:hypothetical protein